MANGSQWRRKRRNHMPVVNPTCITLLYRGARPPVAAKPVLLQQIVGDMAKGGFLMFVITLLSLLTTAYGAFSSKPAEYPPEQIFAPVPATAKVPTPSGALQPEYAIEVRTKNRVHLASPGGI